MAMFFENDEIFNPEIFEVVSRELYAIGNFTASHFTNVRSVPTHTEDGIPIRKLYVSNLPPKTTRSELFGIFAPYGFIKSCWLRMGDRGPNRSPTPTYAFVTFSNPADAHKALLAPYHEKQLHGNQLRISPADSWHQPVEDNDGRVRWKPRGETCDSSAYPQALETEQNAENYDQAVTAEEVEHHDVENSLRNSEEEQDNNCYNILDILNRDCLTHLLSFIPIRDLIRSERVSKKWQSIVNEYLQSIRTFKTSWWRFTGSRLTTAVLRRVLQRLGASLLRLHIDHHWSALNDRTAHTVGKFCPNLEELKVVGMHTKNWKPLIYGCKELKSISFIACNKLTDSSLVHIVKADMNMEKLRITNNAQVTGLFLTGLQPLKLTSLSFNNCYSLQGTVLIAAVDSMPHLTSLRLDSCPVTMWKIIPLILKKLPRLEELSLSEYTVVDFCLTPTSNESDFCESIANLKELKKLDLSQNVYITNAVLKQVAQTCHKLEYLNISSCNSTKNLTQTGVGDEGLAAICASCSMISDLHVSYLAALGDVGFSAISKLKRLQTLISLGNAIITSASVVSVLSSCHYLKELDLCGCDNVTVKVLPPAVHSVREHPRLLALRVSYTAIERPRSLDDIEEEYKHKLLFVDYYDNHCNMKMRTDYKERFCESSSDESFDGIYDHEVFDDIVGQMLLSDDELFLDDDLVDYDGVLDEDIYNNHLVLF